MEDCVEESLEEGCVEQPKTKLEHTRTNIATSILRIIVPIAIPSIAIACQNANACALASVTWYTTECCYHEAPWTHQDI